MPTAEELRASRRAAEIEEATRLPPRVTIGRSTYTDGKLNVRQYDTTTKVTIGAYCSFGCDVEIVLGGEHRLDWASTYPFSAMPDWPQAHSIPGHPATRGDVVIGNDVWVGMGVKILSGANIGDGAVVGAFSVVRGNVAPYTIAGGNPARFLANRFRPEVVERLLRIRWWDWPDDRVAKALPLMLAKDIEAFCDAVERGAL